MRPPLSAFASIGESISQTAVDTADVVLYALTMLFILRSSAMVFPTDSLAWAFLVERAERVERTVELRLGDPVTTVEAKDSLSYTELEPETSRVGVGSLAFGCGASGIGIAARAVLALGGEGSSR